MPEPEDTLQCSFAAWSAAASVGLLTTTLMEASGWRTIAPQLVGWAEAGAALQRAAVPTMSAAALAIPIVFIALILQMNPVQMPKVPARGMYRRNGPPTSVHRREWARVRPAGAGIWLLLVVTLPQLFLRLDADRRRQVHLALCEDALPVWTGYAGGKSSQLRYRDSVVGMWHHVDAELPAAALCSAHAGADLAGVADRYPEPISALQDDDLVFPDPVEFAYYAIYNCFSKYVGGHDISDWLIVNQALSAHADSEAAVRLIRTMHSVLMAANRRGRGDREQ